MDNSIFIIVAAIIVVIWLVKFLSTKEVQTVTKSTSRMIVSSIAHLEDMQEISRIAEIDEALSNLKENGTNSPSEMVKEHSKLMAEIRAAKVTARHPEAK